jgi:hypothetical protein
VICLVTIAAEHAGPHLGPPDIAALRTALRRLDRLRPGLKVALVSPREELPALADELGLEAFRPSAAQTLPWPAGFPEACAALRERGLEEPLLQVDAGLLLDDEGAVLDCLNQAQAQDDIPLAAMRQARDHPCQLFSAWRVTDFAVLAPNADRPAGTAGTQWRWDAPEQGPQRIRMAPREAAPEAVLVELFGANGARIDRKLLETQNISGDPCALLPDSAAEGVALCAFGLAAVTEGGYDISLPWGDAEGLWHRDEASGRIVNDASGEYVQGRQQCPVVCQGEVLLSYLPARTPAAALTGEPREFRLVALPAFPVGGTPQCRSKST